MARADAHYSGNSEEAEIREASVAPARPVTHLKRPNQKQYNKELADICATIGKLLEEQKVLDSKERAETDECRKIRQEKSAEFERKRELEAALKTANQEVVSRSDCLAKLQINLHYKNEARLDEAIRRLEVQLGSCSWKQSEEKKVLDEIDSLKRSKSTLMQYNQLKEELDELKEHVKLTRSAREEVFQSLSALKAKEDHHVRERVDSRARGASVQADLDAFFEAKRKLKDDFSKQKGAYSAQRSAEEQQRAQDKARLAAEQRKRMQPHVEVVKKYHDREHQLCSTLLPYLQRLACFYLDATAEAQANVSASSKEACHEVEGMKRLDKELGLSDGTANVEGLVSAALKKKGKKKRKHRLNKQLCHTPEAISWFIELGLAAPATAADIRRAMEQLTAIKAQHEPTTSGGVRPEHHALGATDAATAGAAAASADGSESYVQTPTSQLASFGLEGSIEEAPVDVVAVDNCVPAWSSDEGIVGGPFSGLSTEGSCGEHVQPVSCPSDAAVAMSTLRDCCCHHCVSAAGASADASDSWPTACGICCGSADVAREAEPATFAAAAPSCASEASLPSWSSSGATDGLAHLADTADFVATLRNYESKSFIHQSLTLVAGGGRGDDAMSTVTMA